MYQIYKVRTHPVVDFAAEELKKYLRMMMPRCGEIPISYAPEAKDGFRLGLTEDFGIALPETNEPELDDVLVIDTDEQGGIIAGSNFRSVLLAVYRYLNENGCRWLFPGIDGEFIPVAQVKPTKYRKMADLRVRAQCNEGAESQTSLIETIDFTPKIGMNSYMIEFDIPKFYYNDYYNHKHNENRDPEPISSTQVLQWKRACEVEIVKRGLLYQDMGHGWTAEPFGISTTEGWTKDENNPIPEEARQYVALTEGSRSLYHGVALNTNFCMSNPKARAIVADAIANYAEMSPQVNYLHVWLADNRNNHCECENCRKKTVSDWYVMLLNTIDERLSAKNLNTRIAFCVYYDTAFPPLEEKLNHPERFSILLAAITRRYTETPDVNALPTELPVFQLNQNCFPSDLETYLAYANAWQKIGPSQKFCYEYHFWIHQYYDLGGVLLARRIFEDVAAYRKAGFCGIIQDGSQRSFFPNGFAFYTYAQAMYDASLDFEAIKEDYFSHAYGEHWREIADYLEAVGNAADVDYLESQHHVPIQKSYRSKEAEEKIRTIPALVDGILPLLNAEKNRPYRVQTVAMRLLLHHACYCKGLAEALILKAGGKDNEANECFRKFFLEFGKRELEIERYFDFCLSYRALARDIFKPVKVVSNIEIG